MMFGRVSKAEALTELRGLARSIQNIYVKGFTEPDMQFEIMMRHLVKVADHIGGVDGVEEVFKGKVKPFEKVSVWFPVRRAFNSVLRCVGLFIGEDFDEID